MRACSGTPPRTRLAVDSQAQPVRNPAYQSIDLTIEQVALAEEGRPNDDPFDALIVAAARRLELPLLTRDQDIARSGLVEVVW